jgi:hypothetical protein
MDGSEGTMPLLPPALLADADGLRWCMGWAGG